MVKVSIVVPVYNVEKHLDKCICSLLSSTLEDIEIILVDDGSSDCSYEICKKYADNDKRIKLLKQENKGAGSARNAGMEIATGEYIGFVDSDDYIEPDMYEKMYNAATYTGTDMAICGVDTHNKDGSICTSYLPFEAEQVLERKDLEDIVIPLLIAPEKESDIGKVITRAMWCRIFKREMIDKYKIRFTNHKNGQDAIFTLNATCKAQNMVVVKENLYHYRNDIGVTLSKGYTEDRFERLLAFEDEYKIILKNSGLLDNNAGRLEQLKRHDVFWAARVIVSSANKQFFLRKIQNLSQLLSHPATKSTFNNIQASQLPLQQKILYFLIRRRLAFLLFCAIRLKYR